jgi:hypothetical protein
MEECVVFVAFVAVVAVVVVVSWRLISCDRVFLGLCCSVIVCKKVADMRQFGIGCTSRSGSATI